MSPSEPPIRISEPSVEQVGVRDPLLRRQPAAEVVLDRGQRDVDDRAVDRRDARSRGSPRPASGAASASPRSPGARARRKRARRRGPRRAEVVDRPARCTGRRRGTRSGGIASSAPAGRRGRAQLVREQLPASRIPRRPTSRLRAASCSPVKPSRLGRGVRVVGRLAHVLRRRPRSRTRPPRASTPPAVTASALRQRRCAAAAEAGHARGRSECQKRCTGLVLPQYQPANSSKHPVRPVEDAPEALDRVRVVGGMLEVGGERGRHRHAERRLADRHVDAEPRAASRAAARRTPAPRARRRARTTRPRRRSSRRRGGGRRSRSRSRSVTPLGACMRRVVSPRTST